jgi:hypothetical protein
MNPRSILQERYPLADFSIYFRHLDVCRTVKGLNTHDHHICPRKQFPELEQDPDNLITLAIGDHAFAHRLLEAACGIYAPSTMFFEMQCWTPERINKAIKAGRRGGHVTNSRLRRLTRTRAKRADAMMTMLLEKRRAKAERRIPAYLLIR